MILPQDLNHVLHYTCLKNSFLCFGHFIMCTIIQVYSSPQNGLFSTCLTVSSDKYVWNISILLFNRTRDLHMH